MLDQIQTQNDMLAGAQDKFKADAATLQTQNTVAPTGGIFKTVAGGKTTFSDRGVGKPYAPGAPALGSATVGLTPFAEQVTTSYTPKPINGISAARSQLTSYQNNLSTTSDQMGQAAVSGIKPVAFGQTPVYQTGNSFSDRMS